MLAAHRQRREDVAQQRVVGEAGEDGDAVRLADPELPRVPAEEVRQRPVRAGDRLRRARGPRGEGDVRQVVRPDGDGRRGGREARRSRPCRPTCGPRTIAPLTLSASAAVTSPGTSPAAATQQDDGGLRGADLRGQARGRIRGIEDGERRARPSTRPAARGRAPPSGGRRRPPRRPGRTPQSISRCAMRLAAASSSAYVHVSAASEIASASGDFAAWAAKVSCTAPRQASASIGRAGSGRTPRAASVASDSAPTRVSGAAAAWRSTPSSCARSARIRGASKRSAA